MILCGWKSDLLQWKLSHVKESWGGLQDLPHSPRDQKRYLWDGQSFSKLRKLQKHYLILINLDFEIKVSLHLVILCATNMSSDKGYGLNPGYSLSVYLNIQKPVCASFSHSLTHKMYFTYQYRKNCIKLDQRSIQPCRLSQKCKSLRFRKESKNWKNM